MRGGIRYKRRLPGQYDYDFIWQLDRLELFDRPNSSFNFYCKIYYIGGDEKVPSVAVIGKPGEWIAYDGERYDTVERIEKLGMMLEKELVGRLLEKM